MKYLDMLAKLGVGSAHPGGFSSTVELLEAQSIPLTSRILEVGCGTGRTACHLAAKGYTVTAVDIRPDMLVKARYRAELDQVNVLFTHGDVEQLPFEDNSFDVVLAESVTIFADTNRALREYYRVLAPGGKLYDREMFAAKPIDAELAGQVSDYYGVSRMWAESEWIDLLEEAGFERIALLQSGSMTELNWQGELQYPDNSGIADPSAYMDEQVWALTREYDEIMFNYGDHFSFGVWEGRKASS